jgi:hypothetical protein
MGGVGMHNYIAVGILIACTLLAAATHVIFVCLVRDCESLLDLMTQASHP